VLSELVVTYRQDPNLPHLLELVRDGSR